MIKVAKTPAKRRRRAECRRRSRPGSGDGGQWLFGGIIEHGGRWLRELEGRENQRSLSVASPSQGKAEREDPEAQDDLRLGPAALLEMMVDRRHEEEAARPCRCAPRPLEPADLEDDRERLHHKDAADDHQGERLVDHEGHDADEAAEGERAVSPMNTSAGCELNQRKAMHAPISAPQMTVSRSCRARS